MPILAVLLGLLIGLSLGALGGGGSILTVPALVHALGQDPRTATTSSLVVVGVTSLVALVPHARAGRVRIGQGLVFGVLGIGGSVAGSALAHRVPPDLLLTAFAGLMLVVAALMLRRSWQDRDDGTGRLARSEPVLSLRPFRCACTQAVKVVATATAVGLLTGFFGVGGGFVLVPALVLALSFSMPVAVGTSLLVIAVNSASALAARAGDLGTTVGPGIDWSVVAPLTAAAVVGSLLGGKVTARVDARLLARGFAVLIAVVAVLSAAQSVPRLI